LRLLQWLDLNGSGDQPFCFEVTKVNKSNGTVTQQNIMAFKKMYWRNRAVKQGEKGRWKYASR